MAKKYVLSCVDGSALTESVCRYSSWIASRVRVPVKLLHVIENSNKAPVKDLSGSIGLGASEDLLDELTTVEKDHQSLLVKKGSLILEAAKELVNKEGVTDVQAEQEHGALAEALLGHENEMRVLVMPIHGGDDEIKSNSKKIESIVRTLNRRILLVNQEFTEPKKVMIAYDGSDAAVRALDMVASTPLFKGVECHIIYVETDETQSETLLMLANNILEDAGLDVKTVKLQGRIEEALVSYQVANDIDITIMGAFGHNRIRSFLLGSFTAKMLTLSKKPLLLMR